MEDNTLVQTSFSATINAPIEKVDIPTWSFGLSESEYQSCSPAHVSAGATNAPDSAYVHQCRSTRPKPQGAAHPLVYFLAPTIGMLAAAAVFLRAGHGARPYCAKLHHAKNKRCIFHHGSCESQ